MILRIFQKKHIRKHLLLFFPEPPVDDVYEGTFPAGKDDLRVSL